MALKLQSFIIIFAFLATSSALFGVSTDSDGRKTLVVEAQDYIFSSGLPGVVKLNPKDPQIVELAKLAVREYNKEFKKNVKFDTVTDAFDYILAQLELVILATGSEGPKSITALIQFINSKPVIIGFI